MKVTFLIGNGFDINLGLNTRYSDFYPYFKENASKDNLIKNWIDGNELLWADLEERLGKELSVVDADNVDQFYDDKDELDELLSDYLEKEQNRFNISNPESITKEFTRSMIHFYDGLSEEEIQSIIQTFEDYKTENYEYSFISFNYTDTLDRIIGLYDDTSKIITTHQCNSGLRKSIIGDVLHIHGTINSEMIVGVNDESQILNDLLIEDDLFLNTIIKKSVNASIGQRKTKKAYDVISDSHIICVFGMSIGNTDKMWWEYIVKWLIETARNKLVVFWRVEERVLRKNIPSRRIRMNDKIKRMVFEKGRADYDDTYYDKVKSRIMISYNASIFSFPLDEETDD